MSNTPNSQAARPLAGALKILAVVVFAVLLAVALYWSFVTFGPAGLSITGSY
jgi:hypothetical protein